MAYSLKSIRYQGSSHKILLQNENGPCPLLAAANALLLRGSIQLPPSCIRNNVASIDNLVNVLAEWCIREDSEDLTSTSTAIAKKNKCVDEVNQEQNIQKAHHINDLLSIFPTLQYGMDVNPKFTSGPTGLEYTQNLTAFDMMRVELVHGWLIDPQDYETTAVVGDKSYNTLTDLVILASEASSEMSRLEELIQKNKEELELITAMEDCCIGDTVKEPELISTQEWVAIDKTHDVDVDDLDPKSEQSTINSHDGNDQKRDMNPNNGSNKQILLSEIEQLRKEYDKQMTIFNNGNIINNFLSETSHQLTYSGLTDLHQHVQEGNLCVFFRNNHFATITKHDGILYLLVTDLGYGNVPEVVWEKLDNISGDTEYADENFVTSQPRMSDAPATGPILSPEQLLAQSARSEADYQLAVQLSKGENNVDEQEGRLIAAATEQSLLSYNKDRNSSNAAATTTTTTGEETMELENPQRSNLDNYAAKQQQEVESMREDMELARKLQEEYEGEQLARQLQEEENRHARLAQERARQERTRQEIARQREQKNSSGCIIS